MLSHLDNLLHNQGLLGNTFCMGAGNRNITGMEFIFPPFISYLLPLTHTEIILTSTNLMLKNFLSSGLSQGGFLFLFLALSNVSHNHLDDNHQ